MGEEQMHRTSTKAARVIPSRTDCQNTYTIPGAVQITQPGDRTTQIASSLAQRRAIGASCLLSAVVLLKATSLSTSETVTEVQAG